MVRIVIGVLLCGWGVLTAFVALVSPEGFNDPGSARWVPLLVFGIPGTALIIVGRRSRQRASAKAAGVVAVNARHASTSVAQAAQGSPAYPLSDGSMSGARLFALDTFVCTKRAPGILSTKLAACFQDADANLVAYAPLALNLLSEEGRRQLGAGIEVFSPDGERLLHLKPRSEFVVRTKTWDVAAPSEGALGSFDHSTPVLLRDQWPVRDATGRQIGVVKETLEWRTFARIVPVIGAFFGSQKYTCYIGDRVGAEIQQVGIGLHIAVDSSMNSRDRRMVVGFCVLRTLQAG